MTVSRRQFLTYLGLGTYAALREAGAAAERARYPLPRRRGKAPDWFQPIAASRADELLVPPGFRADVVVSWGEPLGSRGPLGPEVFGFNNDFLAYFPIDGLKGGANSREGLLWVNHEYPNPLFVSRYTGAEARTAAQVRAEKLSVGGSVLHLEQKAGRWQRVQGTSYTRRFTALYPQMALTGPAAELVPHGLGTLANCSGGRTPWLTALSCEENYGDYNDPLEGWGWSEVANEAIDERQYGWVVEVDPYGELPPQKHSALGRFAHENTTLRLGPTGRLVVYMGDDAVDQYLYKFVSAAPLDRKAARAEQRRVLTEGTLYAADFIRGRWLPLDLKRSPDLGKAGFSSQAEVLLETRLAARALRATPLDRCEDCEVHPLDGSLYVALTSNPRHGNLYGQIVRLVEDDDNPEGESFQYEIFLAGGPQSGLACPDNLAFDRAGNLWVVCDVSGSVVNRGAFRSFGNNGLFVVPTRGDSAGDAFQFASGPVEAELTGPWFTEDEATLFLAVQHPGEQTRTLDRLTSHWPEGGTAEPRPSVVAITGFPR